eukprot:403374086
MNFVHIYRYYGNYNVTNLTVKNLIFSQSGNLFTGNYIKEAYFQNVLIDGAKLNLKEHIYNNGIFTMTVKNKLEIRNLTIKNILIEDREPELYEDDYGSYLKVSGNDYQIETTLLLEDINIECNNYSLSFEEMKENRNGLKPTAERNVYSGQNQGIYMEQFLSIVTKRINITNYYSRPINNFTNPFQYTGFQAISLANFTRYYDENSIYQNILSTNYGVYYVDRPKYWDFFGYFASLPESLAINNCTIQNVVTEYGGLLNVVNLNINVTIENSNIINVSASKNGSLLHFEEEQIIAVNKSQVSILNSNFSNIEVQKNGGIYLRTLNLEGITIENSTFQYLSSDQGGLVFVEAFKGNVEIKNSSFKNLYSSSNGKMIYSTASTFSLLMRDSVINCNILDLQNRDISEAFTQMQQSIQQKSIIQVSNSQNGITLSNNTIQNCGNALKGSFAQIINSNLRDNSSHYSSNQGSAAVIYCSKCNMEIENSIFRDNQANEGGSILIENSGNIQFRNVQFKNNRATQRGGAIAIYQTDLSDQVPLILEISQSIINESEFQIQGNEAYDGGFMYISNKLAKVTISNLTFQNNQASNFGGMIHLDQANSLTIQDSNFQNSSAQNGDSIYSIAPQSIITLHNTSTLCISNQVKSQFYITQSALISINQSQFSNCQSQQSSGVFYLDNSKFEDLNSNYKNNTGTLGGVFYSASTNLTFTNSSFINNKADIAGAFGIQDLSILTLNNCTFLGNQATQSAGAIQVSSSSQIHINNSLFENNYALEKSVLDIQSGSQDVYSVINNTVIKNNRAQKVGISLINAKMIIENSLFYNNSATDVTKNLLLGFSQLIVINSTFDNPVLQDMPLVDNENTIGSFMFLISQVNLTVISSVFKNGRAKQGGAIYLQSESSLYFSNTSFIDNYSKIYGGAIYAQGFLALNFIDGCQFINNQAKELGDDLYLTFSDKLAYFDQTYISNTKSKTSIYAERVQIQIANSTMRDMQRGKEKLSYGSILECYNCYQIVLKDSNFLNSSSQYGGAIYIEETDDSKSAQFQNKTKYLIENCTFANNSSPIGGAIYIYNPQNMLIMSSTFIQNTAFNDSTLISDDIQGSGGVLYYTCLSDSTCQLNIENNTKFINNTAYVQGGAIYWDVQEPYVQNSVIYSNNQAGFYGNNIGCYAQQMVVISKSDYLEMVDMQGITDTQSRRRMLINQYSRQLESSDNSNTFNINHLQSGGNIEVTYLALIDKYGQIVGSDSKSQVRLLVNSTYNTNLSANAYPPILEGTNQFAFGNGVTAVEGVIFSATPGFNQSITLQTDGIDISKNTNFQYMQSLGRSDLDYQLNINLRECNLGERFTTQGKCTLCQKDISFLLQKQTSPGECEDCPTYKAYCLGGAVFGPKPGYWRKSNVTSAIVQCSYQLACLGMVEPNNNPIGDCAQGYQGVICNDCMVGYSRTGENKCGQCPDFTINIVRLIFIIIAIILLIIFLIRSTLQGALNKRNITNIFMKILLNHFQLIMMTASFDFEWSEQTLEFFTGSKQVATVSTQIFSLDCFLDQRIQYYNTNYVIENEVLSYKPSYQDTQVRIFFQKMIMIALLPFILVLFCYVGWYLIKLIVIKRRQKANLDESLEVKLYQKYKVKGKIIASIVIVLFLVHPSIIQFMFYDFKCKEIDGENRVMNDMEVLCWGQQHFAYSMIVAIPSIFLWGLGIPFFALIIMFRVKDQLDIQKIREQYGFLYRGYKNKFFFWEVVIMYRKIIIIFIAVFVNQFGIIAQALVVLVVLIIFLIVNSNSHPYVTLVLNDLENLSLITSMTTIYCGIFFIVDKPQQWIDKNPEYSKGSLNLSHELRQLIFAIILIANMFFFVLWSLRMYQEIQSKFRKSLPKIYTFVCLCNNKNMYDVEMIKNEIQQEHQHLHEQFVKIQSDLSNLFKHKLKLNQDNIRALQTYFEHSNIMYAAGYKRDYQGLDEELKSFYKQRQSIMYKDLLQKNSLQLSAKQSIKENHFEVIQKSPSQQSQIIISKNHSKSSIIKQNAKRRKNKDNSSDHRGSSSNQSLVLKSSSIIGKSKESSDLEVSDSSSQSLRVSDDAIKNMKSPNKNNSNSKEQSSTQQSKINELKSLRNKKKSHNIQTYDFDPLSKSISNDLDQQPVEKKKNRSPQKSFKSNVIEAKRNSNQVSLKAKNTSYGGFFGKEKQTKKTKDVFERHDLDYDHDQANQIQEMQGHNLMEESQRSFDLNNTGRFIKDDLNSTTRNLLDNDKITRKETKNIKKHKSTKLTKNKTIFKHIKNDSLFISSYDIPKNE